MARKLSITLGLLLAMAAFGVPSAWFLGEAWPSFRDYHASRDWVKARAQVLAVAAKPADGAFGPDQMLEARYQYAIAGREYGGTRLQWRDPLDAAGDAGWKQDMQEHLAKAKAEGRPVSVYVNPDRPEESIVDRSIAHRRMTVAAPFAIAGAAIALAFLWLMSELWRDPDEAAIQRAQKARAETVGLAGTWFFVVFWNGFMVPLMVFVLPDLIAEGEWLFVGVLGLFALIGALGLLSVLIGTWRRLLAMVRIPA